MSASPAQPLLEVRALEVEFGARPDALRAVRGLDFEVARGECLALVGESGSGKSATALAVARLLPAGARVRAERLSLDGAELTGLDERAMDALRGRQLGMIFQDPGASLDPLVRVVDQVSEGPRLLDGLGRRAAEQLALEFFERVGLPDPRALAQRFPHQLSGGQQQRVALAMALARGPALLIADEPTTALDVSVQARILALLGDLVARERLGLLLITHDLGVVAQASDRVAVLYAGRIVERGPTAEVLARPRHPYTAALLAAHPGSLLEGQAPRPIPGQPPDPRSLPTGCAFRPRCALARARCAEAQPELEPGAGSGARRSACFFSAEVGRP